MTDKKDLQEFAPAVVPVATTAARFGAGQMLKAGAAATGAAAAFSPKVKRFAAHALGMDKTPEESSASLNKAGEKLGIVSPATPAASTPSSSSSAATPANTPKAAPAPATTAVTKTETKPADKPVAVKHTKGGDYNVYAKGSEKAADFRKTYAAAKGNFEWEGRKYAKPSSETSKPATSTAAPLPPKRPEGLGTTSPGKVTLPSMDVGKPSSGPEFPKNKTSGTPTPPSRPETMNWTLSNRIGVRGNKAELSHDASAIGAYQRQKEYNSAENPKVPQVAPEPKPLDLNKPEYESGKKAKKMSEETNPLIAAFLKLQSENPENMFEAAKKAKKDYDKDGKVESPKDEVWGSRFKAAKAAGKMEEATLKDPKDPSVQGSGDVTMEPAKPAAPAAAPVHVKPTNPEKLKNLKDPRDPSVQGSGDVTYKEEVEQVTFSQAEIDHINSFFLEASVAPNRPEVATGADSTSDKMSQNDVTGTAESGKRIRKEEVELEEGRPKKNPTPETTERDPRKHIQVEAGRAAAGNVVDFTHNDGSKSKITPAMGRRITSHLNTLKPADRQTAVNRMHDSAEGLKV